MLDQCRIIEFPRITDHRGNLSFIEGSRHVPFDVRRVFYVYDIPSGEYRGAHAHRELHQVIVCVSGSLDVHLRDGRGEKTVHLNRPWIGLHIPPMVWAAEDNFSPGTVYMVLASDYYNERDYFRDLDEYLRAVGAGEAP